MDLFNPHFPSAKGSCGTVTHSPGCKNLNIVDHVIGYQLQEQTSAFFSESFTEPLDSIEFIERPLKSNIVKTRQQPRGFAQLTHLQKVRLAVTYRIIRYFTSHPPSSCQ